MKENSNVPQVLEMRYLQTEDKDDLMTRDATKRHILAVTMVYSSGYHWVPLRTLKLVLQPKGTWIKLDRSETDPVCII